MLETPLHNSLGVCRPADVLRDVADRLVGEALQRLRVLVDLGVGLVVLARVVEHKGEVGNSVLETLIPSSCV